LTALGYDIQEGIEFYWDEPVLYYWWSAVEEFAIRKLTTPTDRLPAIAGLASRIQSDKLGDYHAGMWTAQLPASLLWSVDDGRASPGKDYIGPTWSWVAVFGRIMFPPGSSTRPRHLFAELTQIRSYPNSTSQFGTVRAAWLRITGRMSKSSVKRTFMPRPRASSVLNVRRSSFRRDREDDVSKDVEEFRHVEYVWLLLIAETYDVMLWCSYRHCLVLIESTKQPGAFERIDTAKLSDHDERRRGKGKLRWKRKHITII
jgi:hypothetical protein